MATPSSTRNTTGGLSSVPRSVTLHDWWLIKVSQGSSGWRLGVEGFSRELKHGIRAFCSAAIVKRLDTRILESDDGVTITVVGLINRHCTIQNGFSFEVCNHFLFGFPCYWENYAVQCVEEGSINRARPSVVPHIDGLNMPSTNGSSSYPFHKLPATQLVDLFMSPLGENERRMLRNSFFNNLLQAFGGTYSEDAAAPEYLNERLINKVTAKDREQDETPNVESIAPISNKINDQVTTDFGLNEGMIHNLQTDDSAKFETTSNISKQYCTPGNKKRSEAKQTQEHHRRIQTRSCKKTKVKHDLPWANSRNSDPDDMIPPLGSACAHQPSRNANEMSSPNKGLLVENEAQEAYLKNGAEGGSLKRVKCDSFSPPSLANKKVVEARGMHHVSTRCSRTAANRVLFTESSGYQGVKGVTEAREVQPCNTKRASCKKMKSDSSTANKGATEFRKTPCDDARRASGRKINYTSLPTSPASCKPTTLRRSARLKNLNDSYNRHDHLSS